MADEKNELAATGKAIGGIARAKKLPAARRKAIAKKAAQARWDAGNDEILPRATHDGDLTVAGVVIPCYVLADGRRMISHRGLQRSMGRGVSGGAHTTAELVGLIESKLGADKNLAARISDAIEFMPKKGGRSAFGYEATVLADICELVLAARQRGVISGKSMDKLAGQCEILVRAFARVGIIALVDEATGHQAGRDELRMILERYIAKELARWVKTFPNEFYECMYRLRGWSYDPTSVKRPGCVAYYTVDLTYDRLAPDLFKELKEKTDRDAKGRLKHRLHRWLTTDYGHPRLRQHLEGVTVLMKISRSWEEFYYRLNQVYPKLNETALLSRAARSFRVAFMMLSAVVGRSPFGRYSSSSLTIAHPPAI